LGGASYLLDLFFIGAAGLFDEMGELASSCRFRADATPDHGDGDIGPGRSVVLDGSPGRDACKDISRVTGKTHLLGQAKDRVSGELMQSLARVFLFLLLLLSWTASTYSQTQNKQELAETIHDLRLTIHEHVRNNRLGNI
jgi:hypothetical protein